MPILIMALCAALNRMRGDDGWKPEWLPGRALFYVAPIIGLIAGMAGGSVTYGALAASGYLMWAAPAWGHLIGLGRFTPDREESLIETVCLEASCGSVHAAFFLRQLCALPFFAACAFLYGEAMIAMLVIPFGALVVAGYEAGWRVKDQRWSIFVGELSAGAVWGIFIYLIPKVYG